jgi:hypothetical protein
MESLMNAHNVWFTTEELADLLGTRSGRADDPVWRRTPLALDVH